MNDYEYYPCDCGRNHPVGIACAIGRRSKPHWVVGDKWKTPHGHVFEVVQTKPRGWAMLQMIEPHRTRPISQKPIPDGWVKMESKP